MICPLHALRGLYALAIYDMKSILSSSIKGQRKQIPAQGIVARTANFTDRDAFLKTLSAASRLCQDSAFLCLVITTSQSAETTIAFSKHPPPPSASIMPPRCCHSSARENTRRLPSTRPCTSTPLRNAQLCPLLASQAASTVLYLSRNLVRTEPLSVNPISAYLRTTF